MKKIILLTMGSSTFIYSSIDNRMDDLKEPIKKQ